MSGFFCSIYLKCSTTYKKVLCGDYVSQEHVHILLNLFVDKCSTVINHNFAQQNITDNAYAKLTILWKLLRKKIFKTKSFRDRPVQSISTPESPLSCYTKDRSEALVLKLFVPCMACTFFTLSFLALSCLVSFIMSVMYFLALCSLHLEERESGLIWSSFVYYTPTCTYHSIFTLPLGYGL